jgi:hypothetical protein
LFRRVCSLDDSHPLCVLPVWSMAADQRSMELEYWMMMTIF